MTTAAIEALRADHTAFSGLAEDFTAEDWNAPSACEGWAVRDVLGHMTQLFRQVVDPASLPAANPSGLTERTQDRWVEALQERRVEEVLADYRTLGDQPSSASRASRGSRTRWTSATSAPTRCT
ncbi:MAG TPA: maleylpyruvate isomerase N-terminal domain-containing protein [Acidimicrobiales bacterium]